MKPTPETMSVARGNLASTRVASPQSNASSSSLTQSGKSFASFLAPLTPDRFREVVTDVEHKLRIVNQTLSLLDMQGFDTILDEMLTSITEKTGELLNADRTTIYLLDEIKNELYTTIVGSNGRPREVRFPMNQGISGEVAQSRTGINIPFDFFNDPRSQQAKQQYEKPGIAPTPC